jgi:hypothetical protein
MQTGRVSFWCCLSWRWPLSRFWPIARRKNDTEFSDIYGRRPGRYYNTPPPVLLNGNGRTTHPTADGILPAVRHRHPYRRNCGSVMTYVMRDLDIRLACLPTETTREHVGNAIEALKAAYVRMEAIRVERLRYCNNTLAPGYGWPCDDPTCQLCLTDLELRYATISRDKVEAAIEAVSRFLIDIDNGMVRT